MHVCDMCRERWDIKLQENNDQNIIIWYRPRVEAVGKGQLGIARPPNHGLVHTRIPGEGSHISSRSIYSNKVRKL